MNERVNPMYAPCPYAVGDILTTRNAANPSTRWPGTTWKAIETMLLGASSKHPAGSTGGAESVTSGGTVLALRHLPTPTVFTWTNTGAQKTGVAGTMSESINVPTNSWPMTNGTIAGLNGITDYPFSQPHTHTVATMPPYTAVYIWERTA